MISSSGMEPVFDNLLYDFQAETLYTDPWSATNEVLSGSDSNSCSPTYTPGMGLLNETIFPEHNVGNESIVDTEDLSRSPMAELPLATRFFKEEMIPHHTGSNLLDDDAMTLVLDQENRRIRPCACELECTSQGCYGVDMSLLDAFERDPPSTIFEESVNETFVLANTSFPNTSFPNTSSSLPHDFFFETTNNFPLQQATGILLPPSLGQFHSTVNFETESDRTIASIDLQSKTSSTADFGTILKPSQMSTFEIPFNTMIEDVPPIPPASTPPLDLLCDDPSFADLFKPDLDDLFSNIDCITQICNVSDDTVPNLLPTEEITAKEAPLTKDSVYNPIPKQEVPAKKAQPRYVQPETGAGQRTVYSRKCKAPVKRIDKKAKKYVPIKTEPEDYSSEEENCNTQLLVKTEKTETDEDEIIDIETVDHFGEQIVIEAASQEKLLEQFEGSDTRNNSKFIIKSEIKIEESKVEMPDIRYEEMNLHIPHKQTTGSIATFQRYIKAEPSRSNSISTQTTDHVKLESSSSTSSLSSSRQYVKMNSTSRKALHIAGGPPKVVNTSTNLKHEDPLLSNKLAMRGTKRGHSGKLVDPIQKNNSTELDISEITKKLSDLKQNNVPRSTIHLPILPNTNTKIHSKMKNVHPQTETMYNQKQKPITPNTSKKSDLIITTSHASQYIPTSNFRQVTGGKQNTTQIRNQILPQELAQIRKTQAVVNTNKSSNDSSITKERMLYDVVHDHGYSMPSFRQNESPVSFDSEEEDEISPPVKVDENGDRLISILKVNALNNNGNSKKRKLNLQEYKQRRPNISTTTSPSTSIPTSKSNSPTNSNYSSPLPQDETLKRKQALEKRNAMLEGVLKTTPKSAVTKSEEKTSPKEESKSVVTQNTRSPLVIIQNTLPTPVVTNPKIETKTFASIGINTDSRHTGISCDQQLEGFRVLKSAGNKITSQSLITSVVQTTNKLCRSVAVDGISQDSTRDDFEGIRENLVIIHIEKDKVRKPVQMCTVATQTEISIVKDSTFLCIDVTTSQRISTIPSSSGRRDPGNSYSRIREYRETRRQERRQRAGNSRSPSESPQSLSSPSMSHSPSPSQSPYSSSVSHSSMRTPSASPQYNASKDDGDRRTLYIGNIPPGITKTYLYERFKKFGEIEKVAVHLRGNQSGYDDYGFVTFRKNESTYAAVEHGNDGMDIKFDLSFGNRRAFCKAAYSDLDNVSEEHLQFYPPSEELPFEELLRAYVEDPRRRKP